MTTQKIREELKKIDVLTSMYNEAFNSVKSGRDLEEVNIKMNVTRKEMIKCTYKVGKLLSQLEEKI